MSLARTSVLRRFQIMLLVSGLIAAPGTVLPLMAQEQAEVEESLASQTPAPLSTMLDDGASAPAGDLRDALARTVIERNAISTQRDSLMQQRWLILAYAGLTSLLAAWLIRAHLRRPARIGAVVPPTVQSDTTKATKRTNATITIRNAATQEAESTSRMTTRKLFRYRPDTNAEVKSAPPAPARTPAPAPTPTKPLNPQPQYTGATTTVFRAPAVRPPPAATPMPPPAMAPQRPGPGGSDYIPTDAPVNTGRIGEQRSILLGMEADETAPEPEPKADETTNVRIARRDGQVLSRQGLSLLEVMISLAILATVLASVSGGIFSLTTAKRAASEDVLVSNLMQLWSERIIGADWEWLGRDRSDDTLLRGAWSWQRPEVVESAVLPGEYQPLREGVPDPIHSATVQLLGDDQSGLEDLSLYLEYYQPVALELCFTPIDGAATLSTWKDQREAYRLKPPIDLRQHTDAVGVRLLITWTSHYGGARQRELVFARTR